MIEDIRACFKRVCASITQNDTEIKSLKIIIYNLIARIERLEKK